jgi:hypothetical protein
VSLYTSLLAGLAKLEPIDPRDEALVALSMKLAQGIDDAADWADRQRDPLAELGPKLLACLIQLRMTPAARAAALGTPEPQEKTKMDELRERRTRDLGA